MTQTQTTPIPFLKVLKRIDELTRMIRTDGLDAFETAYSDEAGRGFRFEAGRHSEAKPATVPI